MINKKIYLAIPYSGLQEESYKTANEVAVQLIHEGHIVFSPITHSHSLSVEHNLPTNWEFWIAQDEAFVKWADAVYIVILKENGQEKIEKSTGVQGEILIAQQNNIPIKYLFYNELNKKWELTDGNDINWS